MMGIEWLKPGVFFGSMLFALMGVLIFWICFVIIDKFTPYDLWDEIVAIWLVLWLTPDTLLWQAVAFGLFRFFDIVKPQPIRWVDAHAHGGFGVMIDDILAAGYTLVVLALLVRFFG